MEVVLERYLKDNWEENPADLPLAAGAIGYFSYDYGRKFENVAGRHPQDIKIRSFITGRCSGVKVIINDDGGSSGFNPGSYVSGWEGGNFSSCDTITITLAK